MGLSTIVVLIAALGFYVAYQFVGPAPPKRIVLATGEPGGAYHFFGEKFAAYLAEEGIEVELRPTAGSVENLGLLDQEDGADLGFVQGGIANLVAAEDVMAIGSLYLEPLWLFVRSDVSIGTFGDLAGKDHNMARHARTLLARRFSGDPGRALRERLVASKREGTPNSLKRFLVVVKNLLKTASMMIPSGLIP